jgi:hypothetical protein
MITFKVKPVFLTAGSRITSLTIVCGLAVRMTELLINYMEVFFPYGSTTPWGPRPPHLSRFRDHTVRPVTHASHKYLFSGAKWVTWRWSTGVRNSSGRVTSPSQKPLPDNTQHSQDTDLHASVGIRTHNPSKRAAVYPRLRPRDHWDRLWF